MTDAVDRSAFEGALDDGTRAEVRALAARIQSEVGQPPLSDQALARLNAAKGVRHVLRRAQDGALVGYAQQDGTSIELAADEASVPALLDALEPLPAGAEVWSHGRRSPIGAALERRGATVARRLHQLRRPLTDLPDDPPLPDGVTVRSFEPGRDEPAWLAVNAAAFAALPDQGGWQLDDLLAREQESWFDPQGFLLAERGGELLGFHWTKRHTPDLGEVYVLGVAPAAQGLRLGPALLIRGLHHLAARGCSTVLLYVDDSNSGALRLYENTGFTRFDEDVLWRL